jgi:hypothetical protein
MGVLAHRRGRARGYSLGALLACATGAIGPASAGAQLSGSAEAGASVVHYDGFLASTAASFAPEFRFDSRRTALRAFGSLLEYQSGRRTVQGSLSGDVFLPALGPVLPQLDAETGTSSYDTVARFTHALARLRLHVAGVERGGWLGVSAGEHAFAGVRRPVSELSLGGWMRTPLGTAALSLTSARAGDTSFTDAEAGARWVRGRQELMVSGGTRFGGRGGGSGVFTEASALRWLSPRLAVVLAGGRYPSDPVRGSIAGRYLALSLRVTSSARDVVAALRPRGADERSASLRDPVEPAGHDGNGGPAPGLAVDARGDGVYVLRVFTDSASRVEIMADFTGWEPVALAPDGVGMWVREFRLDPSTYRFNVRYDGGPWTVPAGVASVTDDFGGHAGLLVVR